MRVLHVLDHSLPEVSGYSVRSHALLRAQRAAGIDAYAVALAPDVAQPTEQCIDGVPYVWLPRIPRSGPSTWRSSLLRMRGLAQHLSRLLKERRADVLHAHSPSLNGVPALWAARRIDVPLVYELRGLWEATSAARDLSTATALRGRVTRAFETWLMRRVAALVVISQGLRDEAVRRQVAPEKIFHAGNGVDTGAFHPVAPDPDLLRVHRLEGQVVFGYVGFFFAYEGVDVLLRAYARIAEQQPQSRLVLVGGGDQERALRALAKQLGVESRVLFAGAVPHDEVRRWYSVCDVLIYPRRRNRLTSLVTPLKPLEAMAMAKPVVAAAVGGLQELIRDGETGLLCEPESCEAFADALAALAAAPQRRAALGANARRFVCAERDWSHLGPRYESLYRTVLAARAQ